MTTREERNEMTAALLRSGHVDDPLELVAELAAGLLEIAELAMPEGLFEVDSRCNLARAALVRLGDPRAEKYS